MHCVRFILRGGCRVLTYCGYEGGVEGVLAESEQQTCLADPAVPDEQQLEQLAKDFLHPSIDHERRQHKKKRLVQSPNSYFMDVKCPGCYKITTVFSHAQTVVLCVGCSTVLCQPKGGKARLTEGKI
ncbi:hypothetical protein L3Q82_023918 [Scortum barcoo]|uniref:Uncharacterized protein n=1 Tax=Scortum barcoo TaxID=214431 RepID=A0ACB8WUS5_9TELE|nr:hypothetical protein L3Q82_023918 [Scortum barcoo]